MSTVIKTPKALLKKLDNNIIYLKYKTDENFDLEDAILVNNHIYNLAEGKYYSVLIDGKGVYGNITNEARMHYVNDIKTKDIRLAEAIVLDNLPARIFARFYMTVNKPNNPVKIFSNNEDAMNWINEIHKNTPNFNPN